MNLEYRRFNKEKDSYLLDMVKNDEGFNKFFKFDTKSNVVIDNGIIIGGYYISSFCGYPEIQIGVLQEYRRKGYASKILDDLTQEQMDENTPVVYVIVNKKNLASLKLAKKCGYVIDYDNETMNRDDSDAQYYSLYKRNPNYRNSMRR